MVSVSVISANPPAQGLSASMRRFLHGRSWLPHPPAYATLI
jgi:hypothetical protein